MPITAFPGLTDLPGNNAKTPRVSRNFRMNKEKAENLITAGRMKPSGLKVIEAAMENGYWENAYEPQSTASMPEDFALELVKSTKAKTFYNTLDSQNKYAILFRINKAKK